LNDSLIDRWVFKALFLVGPIKNVEDPAHELESNAAENIQLDSQKENEKLQHRRNRRTPQWIECGIEELYPELYNQPAINKENQHDNEISNNNQTNSTSNWEIDSKCKCLETSGLNVRNACKIEIE